MTVKEPHVAILASFSGQGGVERMVLNLVREFARRGLRVDLLPIRAEGAHFRDLPDGVTVIDLGVRHAATSITGLAGYLRRVRPPALLAAKDRAGRAAVWARRLAGVDTRIVIRLGTTLSAALEDRGWLARRARYWPMRLAYPGANRIVAVSQGVADDTRSITGLPAERIVVVRNPVITPELPELAAAEVDHPWFHSHEVPVLLGVGRLTRQKDFPTLVRAFARVRGTRPCRLIVLGEGRDRPALEALAGELGVAEDLDLPGFTGNPYAWMARAGCFVLSSRWEGSPNVLTEAMALGTPVVATDCPSGPREVLRGGEVAPLVAMGDDAALAEAIGRVLDAPPRPETLQNAVAEYTVERSADGYLAALGLQSAPDV
ncbi:MAG TPA: glycosyltransferase [Gammaproteobacteria bacterium]|nr:glycosyltransferase [Gammaproteobacteria bacterium]